MLDFDSTGADLHPYSIAVDLDLEQLAPAPPTPRRVCAHSRLPVSSSRRWRRSPDEDRITKGRSGRGPVLPFFISTGVTQVSSAAVVEQRGDGGGRGSRRSRRRDSPRAGRGCWPSPKDEVRTDSAGSPITTWVAIRQVVQLSRPGSEAGSPQSVHRRHRPERRAPSGQHGGARRGRSARR